MGADGNRVQPLKARMKPLWGCFRVSSTSQTLEFSVSFTIGYFDNGIASSSNEYIPSIGSSFSGEVNVIPSRTCAHFVRGGGVVSAVRPLRQQGVLMLGPFFYV